MALEMEGLKAEALAAYRRAVEIDSGHLRAVANVARLEPLVPPVEPATGVESELAEGEPESSSEPTDDLAASTLSR
jgi:hypothetical protein